MKRFVNVDLGIDKLKTTLANSRISASNNALYQTIFNLIDKLNDVNDNTAAQFAAISTGGGSSPSPTPTPTNNGGPVSRLVALGQTVTIADTFCLIVVDYYHVIGSLVIQGDGVLKVIPA